MSQSDDRLLIDGREVQLDGRIAINLQGGDLGNQARIRETFTHTIELGRTQRNEEILGFPSDAGADFDSLNAYASKRADIYSGGVLLLPGGKLGLVTAGDKLRVNVVGKGVDFWDVITGKSIRDLDWGSEGTVIFGSGGNPKHGVGSLVIYPWIETWINPDYKAVSGGPGAHGTLNPYIKISRDDHLVPFISKTRILEQIILEAGFSYRYRTPSFIGDMSKCLLNSYISMQVPNGKRSNYIDSTVDVSEWCHDIQQDEFIRSILYQYGAFLVVQDKVVYIVRFEENAQHISRALDWSKKINLLSQPERTYDIGYAQVNKWKYKEFDQDQIGKLQTLLITNSTISPSAIYSSRVGQVESLNKNTDKSRVVGEIAWQPILQFKVNNAEGNPRQIGYLPVWDHSGAGKFTETYPPCDLVVPDNETEYRTTAGAAETWSGSGNNLKTAWHSKQESKTTNLYNTQEAHGLSFSEKLIPYFYGPKATRFIREPLRVSCIMNLNAYDIRNYSDVSSFIEDTLSAGAPRSKPVFIEELNGYFHVDRISSYVAGRPCQVTLTRI